MSEKYQRRFDVDADGTIHVGAFQLPLSVALSPEARMAQINGLTKPRLGLPSLAGITNEAEFIALVDKFRHDVDSTLIAPLSQMLASAFPVAIRADKIAGVPVEEFTPEAQTNEQRVLINLHGGAFFSGAIFVSRTESIPVAHLGKIKVVSLDYRQGYEHKYPAATEDVVAVYLELLKTYRPENIGIYGGSAGAMLTAQAVAWLLDKGLPAPGAIGVFGCGAGGSGDSIFFSKIGSAEMPPTLGTDEGPMALVSAGGFGYFSDVAADNYLAFPQQAPRELLAQFPPTLLISATRAFDMSPAIAFHRALVRAGVDDASLHIFDGLGHCFYYNAWLPEARDAYDTIIRFFNRHLGKPAKK
ncbi:MAG TPA: alpha/beta hydrolase [Spongiibacteraceae bacterium]